MTPAQQEPSGCYDLIDSDPLLETRLESMANDPGPVGVDTERASGFRYVQCAYLIQLKMNSTGVLLIDPVNISEPVMAELDRTLSTKQWIIHSATQDLPSLRMSGLNPHQLFDTELAARMLGRTRVGLGPLIEDVLEISLAKEFANSDWSTRPLPQSWLTYATHDVEYLIELAAALTQELEQDEKLDWANQEFNYLITAPPPQPKTDPWRSTTGIHLVKNRTGMAVIKLLWETRDQIAQDLDLAPHRIVKDRAISALASAVSEGTPIPQLSWPDRDWNTIYCRAYLPVFQQALKTACALLESNRPPMRSSRTDIPAPSRWSRQNPEADQRWKQVRPAVIALAETHRLPVEILIAPKAIRSLLWDPIGLDPASISHQLTQSGVRPWQHDLLVDLIADLLSA